jgi:hypothetical protein
VPTSFATAPPPAVAHGSGHSRGGSLEYQRVTRSNSTRQQATAREPRRGIQALPQPSPSAGTVTDVFYPPRPQPPQGPAPLVAFLNLDLRILKCNEVFRSIFQPDGDPRGRLLSEFVDQRHSVALTQLQNGLREERTRREPTFLPGIFPGPQEQQAVETVDERDVDRITQGFDDRAEQWTYVLPGGQLETMLSRVRLAKTSIYFAVIVLRRIAQPSPRRPAGFGRPRSIELAAAGSFPPPQPSPTHMQFLQSGPRSPFVAGSSAPSSPFANLLTLGTSLPPTTVPSLARTEQGYFAPTGPLLTAPLQMQPPPQPSLAFSRPPSANTEIRPSSARERRRPEPLGSLYLPPIVSSAPTTPMTGDFFQHHSTPQAGSAGARTPDQGEGGEGQEESGRKRRRMDITDIVEK